MPEQEERLTATEVVMKALEDFGESEATSIMVLYINKDEDIVCHSNMKRVEAVGILEVAKNLIFERKEE